jgi:prepilin-type N-terminal cleavage/methylation domain-containing protein
MTILRHRLTRACIGVRRMAMSWPLRRAEVRTSRDAGFTLVEMMVAVAILAVLAGVVPRTFVFARSIIDHSRGWVGARLVAESVLNDTLAGPGLQPGARSGELDGRRWRATLRPQGVLGKSRLDSGQMLLDVRLEVDVSPGRTLEVETMRVGVQSAQ